MNIIQEFSKKKIRLRRTEPIASTVYSYFVTVLTAIEKEEKRKVTEDDVITVAQSASKKLISALENIPKNSELYNLYISEIVIYKTFLPKMADDALVEKFITAIIINLPEDQRNSRSFGKVIQAMRREFGQTVDMGKVSLMIKEKL